MVCWRHCKVNRLVKDGENNLVNALHIDNAHPWPRASSDCDETALDHIRGPQLPPELALTLEEGAQLRHVPEQVRHKRMIGVPPASDEDLRMVFCLGPVGRLIDRLGIGLDRRVISSPTPH